MSDTGSTEWILGLYSGYWVYMSDTRSTEWTLGLHVRYWIYMSDTGSTCQILDLHVRYWVYMPDTGSTCQILCLQNGYWIYRVDTAVAILNYKSRPFFFFKVRHNALVNVGIPRGFWHLRKCPLYGSKVPCHKCISALGCIDFCQNAPRWV